MECTTSQRLEWQLLELQSGDRLRSPVGIRPRAATPRAALGVAALGVAARRSLLARALSLRGLVASRGEDLDLDPYHLPALLPNVPEEGTDVVHLRQVPKCRFGTEAAPTIARSVAFVSQALLAPKASH